MIALSWMSLMHRETLRDSGTFPPSPFCGRNVASHLYLDNHVKMVYLLSCHKGTSSYCRSSSDAIAEPLYALIGEVFDMRGVFKLLRKSLMTFVQITYGR